MSDGMPRKDISPEPPPFTEKELELLFAALHRSGRPFTKDDAVTAGLWVSRVQWDVACIRAAFGGHCALYVEDGVVKMAKNKETV